MQIFSNCPFRQIRYFLTFDSMDLDGSTKYDGVRRLTNSDRNPYFPSRWKLYWWNNFNWEEYNKVNSPHRPLLFLPPTTFYFKLHQQLLVY